MWQCSAVFVFWWALAGSNVVMSGRLSGDGRAIDGAIGIEIFVRDVLSSQ